MKVIQYVQKSRTKFFPCFYIYHIHIPTLHYVCSYLVNMLESYKGKNTHQANGASGKETDRIYFTPWPSLALEELDWIYSSLATICDSLSTLKFDEFVKMKHAWKEKERINHA